MSDENGFKRVVERIYELAKQLYDNDIQTHIQAIYNRLSDAEQNIFLKGLLPLLFEFQTPSAEIAREIQEQEEEFSIEQYNQVELIRLKSWLVKCVIITISFVIGISVIYFIIRMITHHDSNASEGIFEEFEEFLGTLLDL